MVKHIKSHAVIYILSVANAAIIGILLFYLLHLPINNYSLPISDADASVGRTENDGYYFDMEHGELLTKPSQKIFLNIPVSVSKGSYDIIIKHRSAGASTVSVTSLSHPEYVKCDNIALNHLPDILPGSFNMDYGLDYLPGYQKSNMYITHDVDDLDVYVIYSGFQAFYIESVELVGNRNYIKTIIPAFILILLFIDFITLLIAKKPWFTKKQSFKYIIALTVLSVIASVPIFYRNGIHYDDFDFLYNRIEGLKNGLMDGQFPVMIHTSSLKRYGYALSCFYPDFFIYPFAFLRILGYSLRFVISSLLFTINISTAFVSYYCIKKIYRSDMTAFAGSFLYLFSLYRLVDMFSRGAVAEALAMIFLPLFVYGLYHIVIEDSSYVPLTIAVFGIINSHILSCEMVAVFSVLTCILCIKRLFKINTLIKLLKSCTISVLLSAYFIIPFLHMATTDTYKVFAENAYLTSDNTLAFSSLFSLFCSTFADESATFLFSRYCLGFFFVLLTAACIVYICIIYRKADIINSGDMHEIDEYKFSFVCMTLGFLAVIMTTSVFPWKLIENTGGFIKKFICMIQFPWRYLSVSYVLFVFAICKAIKTFVENKNTKTYVLRVVAIIGSALIIIPAIVYFYTVSGNTSETFTFYESGGLGKYLGVGMGEYEPVTFPDDISFLDKSIEELQILFNKKYSEEYESGTLLTIESFEKSGTKATAVVLNPTDEQKILYMPYTYYYGYTVSNTFDGMTVPELFETEYGTIGVIIPPSYYNGVHLEYKTPLLYRFAEAFSAVTLVILLIFQIYKKRNTLLSHK